MRRMTASSPVPISQPAVASRAHALWELAGVFLKLSVTGLGGPAAHIATMEAELVRRRRWLAHDEFMDLLGATYLIPGPNSTSWRFIWAICAAAAGVWWWLASVSSCQPR
jgi:chromate transport protein ChrA